MALITTFFLGIFIMAGALIARSAKNGRLIGQLSVSIAFGTMSALAVLELLPEAIENLGASNRVVLVVCVLAGIAMLRILDHFIPDHDNAPGFDHHCSEENIIHIGIISSVAIILHNIIEGMAVYSITEQSLEMGALVALGVGLHNIPMGMIIYSTLSREKRSRKLILLFAASLSTFAGGLTMKMMWFLIDDFVIGVLIAITLGMIIYIVVFELFTLLKHSPDKKISVIGTAIGIAIIVFSGMLE